MNRSVLIIICDFLLLMLIATARLDRLPTVANPSGPASMQLAEYHTQAPQPTVVPQNTTQPNARTADLLDSMKSSLEEERSSRQNLSAMLTRTEQALKAQQQLATDRARELTAAQQNLRSKEEEARRLDEARNVLAGKFAEAQSNMAQIQQRLTQTSDEARKSQERLTNIQTQYAAA